MSNHSAAEQWRESIEDREALLSDPEARHRHLVALVEHARSRGASPDDVCEMLEITDSALLWAKEENL